MENTALLYGDDLPEGILTDTHIHVPGLEPMPLDHEAWQDWARNQLAHRERVVRDCNLHPRKRAMYKALCSQPHGLGQIYFAVTFCWIYEPREDDDLSMVPFILFPRQAQYLLARDAAMRRPKGRFSSMVIPKSRGVGATWLAMLDQTWRWLFKRTYQGRVVSRTEDLVDKPGDSDSMFWKLDYLMKYLPAWLVPDGYSTERRGGNHFRTHMSMIHPQTGSAILGEATTSGIGVGKRATAYDIDEASRLRGGHQVHGQLVETTNHQFWTSTHNIDTVDSNFWDMSKGINKWQDRNPVIFEMAWDCVPGRDEQWLAETRKAMTNDMFQREVMMDPHAGISTWGYPQARTMQARGDVFWTPGHLGLTALDDGYDDDFALIFAQWDRVNKRLKILDGYRNSHKPIVYYGQLLRGIPDGKWPWDSEAMRLMQWIRQYKLWENVHIGDRHGDNTDLSSGVSPWQKLTNEFGINVLPSSHIANDDKSRRDAASEMLMMTDFANTPGAWGVLEALQNSRFPEARDGSTFAHEHRRMIHDQTSHYRTAFEYLARYVLETFAGRSFALGGTSYEPVRNTWMTGIPDLYNRNRRHKDQGVNNGWIR